MSCTIAGPGADQGEVDVDIHVTVEDAGTETNRVARRGGINRRLHGVVEAPTDTDITRLAGLINTERGRPATACTGSSTRAAGGGSGPGQARLPGTAARTGLGTGRWR